MLELKLGSPIIMSECVVSDKTGRTMLFIKTFNNPEERILEIAS